MISLTVDYCLTVYLLYYLFIKLFWPCQKRNNRNNTYGNSLFSGSFIKRKGIPHFAFSHQLLWKSPWLSMFHNYQKVFCAEVLHNLVIFPWIRQSESDILKKKKWADYTATKFSIFRSCDLGFISCNCKKIDVFIVKCFHSSSLIYEQKCLLLFQTSELLCRMRDH